MILHRVSDQLWQHFRQLIHHSRKALAWSQPTLSLSFHSIALPRTSLALSSVPCASSNQSEGTIQAQCLETRLHKLIPRCRTPTTRVKMMTSVRRLTSQTPPSRQAYQDPARVANPATRWTRSKRRCTSAGSGLSSRASPPLTCSMLPHAPQEWEMTTSNANSLLSTLKPPTKQC